MKKFYLLSIVFMISSATFCQTTVPGGWVSGTWNAAGSPYIVQGSIQAMTLTIQPGVDVRFQNGSGLTVWTWFKAQGTAAQPIIFESDDTTGFANMSIPNGGTSGIYIYGNATDSNIIDHCIIRDCKGLINNNYAVCLGVYSGKLFLTNSEIYHNYISGTSYIVSVNLVPPLITNNIIHDNYGRGCGGIAIWQTSGLVSDNELYGNSGNEGGAFFIVSAPDTVGPVITNNNIHHNRAYFDGGGIMLENGPVTISNNIIAYNRSARAGSGIYDLYASAKIISNIVCNNTDSVYSNCGINDGGGGININNGNTPITCEVINNIVANNVSYFSGGGIRLCPNGAGSIIVENNTIVNNFSHSYFTGGLEIASGDHVSVRNNIIWGNRGLNTFSGSVDSVQVIMGANDTVSFEYNCGEYSYLGGMITNTGTQVNGNSASNIAVYGVDPGFVAVSGGYGDAFDGAAADWHLTSQSVCYDSGNSFYLQTPPQTDDVYGAPRISGLLIDIGAAEYQNVAGISEHISSDPGLYPDPVVDVLHVKDLSPFTDVFITNSLGQIVSSVKYGNGVDVSSLVPGAYFISFRNDGGLKVNAPFLKN
ncbi:MAG TPA: T9SS type A sorting domain-containing protein [Bacteroidia bacterium]|jgi:hypothetical protein|nr:T9SS type A sorting domain-containing protein [Bacteroidia bacterium]